MKLIKSPRERWDDITEDATPMHKITAQKIKIPLGPLHLTVGVGDENNNGIVDVSFKVSLVGVTQLPPLVIDLSAELAQQAIDGAKALGAWAAKAFAGRKPK